MGGHACSTKLDRIRDSGQRDRTAGPRRHVLEYGVLPLPVEKVQRRDSIAGIRRAGGFSSTRTIRSALAYGSGLRRTPSTKLKMAVFAPMPIASVRMATIVKAGLLRRVREAYERS